MTNNEWGGGKKESTYFFRNSFRGKRTKIRGKRVTGFHYRRKPVKSFSNFSLILLNAQGMNNKIEEISNLLQESKPDVFCITEHHLNKEQAKLIKLPGFVFADKFCREEKTKGGTGIFIRDDLDFKLINLAKYSKEGEFELAGIYIENGDVRVLTVYRPPKGKFDAFISTFNLVLEKICSDNSKLNLICGDFNVNLSESVPTFKKNKNLSF